MVDFSDDLIACLAVLHAGGNILYPTDTIWGVGCDATNQEAIERVFELKHRPKEKSLIVLLAEKEDLLNYTDASVEIFDLIDSFEKPTTIIFSGAKNLAGNAIAANGSVAIRIPDDAFCQALLRQFGKPIISTSANVSGEKSPAFFSEISGAITSGADYVVKYRQDDNTPKAPSSIIRVHEDGSREIIRP